jgi:hypothetical protein
MAGQFHMRNCKHCGQRIIQRGTTILNVRGTPLNHRLSCPAQLTQTPADEKSDGSSTSISTQGDDAA